MPEYGSWSQRVYNPTGEMKGEEKVFPNSQPALFHWFIWKSQSCNLIGCCGQLMVAILPWPTCHSHFATTNLVQSSHCSQLITANHGTILNGQLAIGQFPMDNSMRDNSIFVNGNNVKATVADNIYCIDLSWWNCPWWVVPWQAVLWWVGQDKIATVRWLWWVERATWIGHGKLS